MGLSFDAAGRVLRHVGRLLLLRADLAAEELGLAQRQWIGWIGAALAAMVLLSAGLVAGGAWLTLLLWDRFGAATAGVLAIVLVAAALLLLRAVARAAAQAPAPLSRTRTALREDCDALAGAASAPSEPQARQ